MSVCFSLAIWGTVRRYNAGRSAEALRRLVAAHVRFAKIRVLCATNARVFLDGQVASAGDLDALRRLVQQAHLPTQPAISVRIETPAPNKPASGDTGFRFRVFLALWPGAPEPGCYVR